MRSPLPPVLTYMKPVLAKQNSKMTIPTSTNEQQKSNFDDGDPSLQNFLNAHKSQLEVIGVPELYWKSLFRKLTNDVFDAGTLFSMAQDEEGGLHVILNETISNYHDSDMIFLIDHAWTFTLDQRREMIEKVPGLLDRLMGLIGFDRSTCRPEEDEQQDLVVEKVMDGLWKHMGSYKINDDSQQNGGVQQVFFLMDEFGSAIDHSDEPNFVIAPFYFMPTGCAYSLLWPVMDRVETLTAGDIVFRDHILGTSDSVVRTAKLNALQDDVSCDGVSAELLHNSNADGCRYPGIEQEEKVSSYVHKDADEALNQANYDGQEGSSRSSVVTAPRPKSDDLTTKMKSIVDSKGKIKVFSDLVLIEEFLSDDNFECVEDQPMAQLVWPTWHINQFPECHHQLLNQFENEKVLTCKDLMYETCLRAKGGTRPSWLALTFNMETEFPALIREHFKRAKQEGKDVVWICKPWNLSRGLDITIVNNAAALVKIAETGPKIACEYITNPVLFEGNKFDMRFIVLVCSTDPLKVYVVNEFWLRFANLPFSLDSFDNFEKHFTVMNYSGCDMRVLSSLEFIELFNREYPAQNWEAIQKDVYAAIVDLFTCVTKDPPPLGLGRASYCRAMYGVDVMLEWRDDGIIKPVILETNFSPDCVRPCKSNSDFWNGVFRTIVLDEGPSDFVTRLR